MPEFTDREEFMLIQLDIDRGPPPPPKPEVWEGRK